MKPTFSFGKSFYYRVAIPGIIGAITLYPLFIISGMKIGLNKARFEYEFLVLSALIIGLFITFLDNYIYSMYRGQSLMPKWLKVRLIRRLNEKLNNRWDNYYIDNNGNIDFQWLMYFPIRIDEEKKNKRRTIAKLPTILGNIHYALDEYPFNRYGMDTRFFWERIWLVLEDETKKEIDGAWAEADCCIYISFLFMISAIAYLIIGAVDFANLPSRVFGNIFKQNLELGAIPVSISLSVTLVAAVIVLLFLARMMYKISLPLHAKNSDKYHSIYDTNIDKLDESINKQKRDPSAWMPTYYYSKLLLEKCSKCNEYYKVELGKCPNKYCGDSDESSD